MNDHPATEWWKKSALGTPAASPSFTPSSVRVIADADHPSPYFAPAKVRMRVE